MKKNSRIRNYANTAVVAGCITKSGGRLAYAFLADDF